MGGAEVLPIRSMKPEEKNRWLQQLFTLVSADKGKGSGARSRASSSSRFEAPRNSAPVLTLVQNDVPINYFPNLQIEPAIEAFVDENETRRSTSRVAVRSASPNLAAVSPNSRSASPTPYPETYPD